MCSRVDSPYKKKVIFQMLDIQCGILQLLFPILLGYCFIFNISGKRIWTWSADTFLINMTVFETGLKIGALHARFTEFS